MESTIVIKVKHEEILRRFSARIVGGELALNIDALREKIIGFFKFNPHTEFVLTYVDEDNDMVTLADDDDLRDVVRQALNPLRITVKLSNEKSGWSSARTSGRFTPLRFPRVLQPSLNLNCNVGSNTFPDQFFADVVQFFSNMRLPCTNQLPDFQAGAYTSVQGGVPGCTTNVTASLDTESLKADGAASKVLSSVGSEKPSSRCKEVLLNYRSNGPEPKNEEDNSANTNGGVKALARQVPGLEAVMKTALDTTNPKPPHTVQTDASKKKEVDCQTGEHLSNFMHFSSSNVPPVSSTATANNKDVSDKPNESSGTKSNNAHTSTIYPSKVMWIEESIGGAKNAFETGLGNSSHINLVPSPMNECPFTGVPLYCPSVVPQLPPRVVQPRRNHGFSDGPGIAFHRAIECDGCGVHPITGPRFKSKVKDDYDLCTSCFTQMGNENDYTRIDRPDAYRHPYSFKGLCDLLHPPSQPPVFRCGVFKKPVQPKLDSRFIQDVNILDGTVMAPSTPFTKIWRMRNNGSLVWPQGTQLVWIGGDKLSDIVSVQIEIASAGIPVEQELDVAVDFVAPDRPGVYISSWRMASPSGQKFGEGVWVLIQVDASLKERPHEGFGGFDLNLPPVSSGILSPETINVTPEPMVEDSLPEVDNSNGAMNLVEPMFGASPDKEQEVNFLITDTLPVGGSDAISSPVPAAPSSSGSYPINYMSEVAPVLPVPLPPVTVVQSAQDVKVAHVEEDSHLKYVKEKSEVEETLLKDLEEMGFKQVDLNKEILRLNEYDLEKSVDDLCDVAGWDPILEELHDMGFCDKATNQKLLKKNSGSIKRVVMDLIAEEL